ncbi:MAG: tRNA pseudouridine(13) synthase TruD [Caldilineales bacterium]|nr:tRNA pseudouridine(13) synthase TruD [Caldilineales bacterium]MDW8318947.1 tRNA pseudouridine(13) synthase TruD [Anaerolineae bacterium]
MDPTAPPFFTADLPGCGGRIKADPAHFVVEEVPLYEPDGSGQHLHVRLTRSGWTTRQVVEALARLYNVPAGDIGYAGLKDRHAVCTQTFSLPGLKPEDARRIADELPFQVHWARLHHGKLKLGHLLGNRFRITVTELAVPVEEALARAQAVAAVLVARGLPNYFGAQRFGVNGANVGRGRAALMGGGPRDKWLRRLMLSAYQSYLFNLYLQHRLDLGLFDRVLPGDVAKKTDTGGMFDVVDAEAEQPRYDRQEINYTGPLYGAKMWPAKAQAAELEQAVLDQVELTLEHFRRAHVQGSRRPARLLLKSLEVAADQEGLHLAFFLPKGAYATVVVREFTKTEADSTQFLDSGEEDHD